MTGALPKDLVAIRSLRVLNMAHGRFNEYLPGAERGEDVWRCTRLTTLRLDHNRFQGPLPRELFERCTELEVCLLSNNSFSGELPRSVGKCTRLVELDVHVNFFSGYVPCTQLMSCRRLKLLNLMHQRAEDPLIVMVDDGSKASLVAALGECYFMWPGDEAEPTAVAATEARLKELTKARDRTHKQREMRFQELKDSETIAAKAEETLASLEEHLAKVKAQAKAAREKQRASFDAFMEARESEAHAASELRKFEHAVHGVAMS